MDEVHLKEKDDIALGFGKAASLVLAGYFIIKVMGISEGNHWHLLNHLALGWILMVQQQLLNLQVRSITLN